MSDIVDLAALDKAATQAELDCPVRTNKYFLGGICPKCKATNREPCRPMTFAYNAFGKALSDAYRSGELVAASELAAALRAGAA